MYRWCRRPDLNRHGFWPLPPQDSVSTKFHHFGIYPKCRVPLNTVYSVFAGSDGVVVCGAAVSPWAGDAGCSIGAVVVSMIESEVR